MSQPNFNPDIVWNLISNSPQGRAFVENLAKMSQLQQAIPQLQQAAQQFGQNPVQTMQNLSNWAQNTTNQMPQQPTAMTGPVPIPSSGTNLQYQPEPGSSPQQNPQQGGTQPMQGNMMSMALGIVGEFKDNLSRMDDKITTLQTSLEVLSEEIRSFMIAMSNQNGLTVKNNVNKQD